MKKGVVFTVYYLNSCVFLDYLNAVMCCPLHHKKRSYACVIGRGFDLNFTISKTEWSELS